MRKVGSQDIFIRVASSVKHYMRANCGFLVSIFWIFTYPSINYFLAGLYVNCIVTIFHSLVMKLGFKHFSCDSWKQLQETLFPKQIAQEILKLRDTSQFHACVSQIWDRMQYSTAQAMLLKMGKGICMIILGILWQSMLLQADEDPSLAFRFMNEWGDHNGNGSDCLKEILNTAGIFLDPAMLKVLILT